MLLRKLRTELIVSHEAPTDQRTLLNLLCRLMPGYLDVNLAAEKGYRAFGAYVSDVNLYF